MMQTSRIRHTHRHPILVQNTPSITFIRRAILRTPVKFGLILVSAFQQLQSVVNLRPFLEPTVTPIRTLAHVLLACG